MRTPGHLIPAFALLFSVVVTQACGGARPSRPSDAPQTTVAIDNQGFNDMTIYIVDGGQRIRLGRVIGKSTATLIIPPSILRSPREVQFLADPLASNRASVSERIWVTPGEQVSLRILP
jgi:hypothetical protein